MVNEKDGKRETRKVREGERKRIGEERKKKKRMWRGRERERRQRQEKENEDDAKGNRSFYAEGVCGRVDEERKERLERVKKRFKEKKRI